MADTLTEGQMLVIDLELPAEAWDFESYDIENIASLFRLIFWTGYVRGQDDPESLLHKEVVSCVSMP